MTGPVVVVEMTSGITTWAWLCAKCIAARVAAGWSVKRKDVIAFGCDECTPQVPSGVAVDYSPTSKGARRPTREECPPPRLIPPRAKPGQTSKQRTVSGEERA